MIKLHGNIVIVVDEAHNFGAEKLSRSLLQHIPYRLALSATIDRHGDPEGTQKLIESELLKEFEQNPPSSIPEAVSRIKEKFGITLTETPVRYWLKKGLRYLSRAYIDFSTSLNSLLSLNFQCFDSSACIN